MRATTARRRRLLAEVRRLANQALIGSVSETYRTCGNPDCRCHKGGPKHGPHVYVSYRGDAGKTTGYYVPTAARSSIRRGIAAWRTLQKRLRELAKLNKLQALARPHAPRNAR